jgi:mono/diheme cytochrome c family protein
MRTQRSRGILLVAVAVAVTAGVMADASAAQSPQAPSIKLAPCEPIPSVDGKDSFMAYCAVCHGADAKGGGPAAAALSTKVPDLTTLAQRQGGKFNPLAVQDAIAGTSKVPAAHGSSTMPIWGPAFRTAEVDRARAMLRVQNLAEYIRSLQQGT